MTKIDLAGGSPINYAFKENVSAKKQNSKNDL